MDRPGEGRAARLWQPMSMPEQGGEASSSDKSSPHAYYVPPEERLEDPTGSQPTFDHVFVPGDSITYETAPEATLSPQQRPGEMQAPKRISLWRPGPAVPAVNASPEVWSVTTYVTPTQARCYSKVLRLQL